MRRLLPLVVCLAWSCIAQATITLVGETTVPADNSAQTGPTVTVDKDAGSLSSAQAGDLILVAVGIKAGDTGPNTILPNELGGQHWNIGPTRVSGQTGRIVRFCWAVFNGTWSADPSFSNFVGDTPTSTAPMTAWATVWRPTSGSDYWGVNYDERGTFTAGTTPFTKTITGFTPTFNSSLSVALWYSADDNTWDSLSGTNWTQTSLSAQVRNTSGTDTSMAMAYQIQTTAAATNNVSLNQATLGGDAGDYVIANFYEYSMPSGASTSAGNFVQSADAESTTDVSSLSPTFVSNVTQGNSVVVFTTNETTTGNPRTTVQDNNGNIGYNFASESEMNYDQWWTAYVIPNIQDTDTSSVTVTYNTASPFVWAVAIEANLGDFDGVSAVVLLDPDFFSTLPVAVPAITPSDDGAFFAGISGFPGGGAQPDITGWTTAEAPAGGDEKGYYLEQSTAASEDMNYTSPANESHHIISIMGVWVPAATGGGGVTDVRMMQKLGASYGPHESQQLGGLLQ